MQEKNMKIYKAEWNGQETFRMMPISQSCPFIDVIYDVDNEILIVISKDKKQSPIYLPLEKSPDDKDSHQENLKEMIVDTYYEYYIENVEDIFEFIRTFCQNRNHSALKILKKK